MTDIHLNVALQNLAKSGHKWAQDLLDEMDRLSAEGFLVKQRTFDGEEFEMRFHPVKE